MTLVRFGPSENSFTIDIWALRPYSAATLITLWDTALQVSNTSFVQQACGLIRRELAWQDPGGYSHLLSSNNNYGNKSVKHLLYTY